MHGRKQQDDELSRRRTTRERLRRSDPGPGPDLNEDDDDMPKFSWSDTFAMIIAAYQVLLPMLLAMVGVMLAAYFLFQLLFS